MADGYSASYFPGDPVSKALVEIFTATNNNLGFIVGRSAWDTDTCWWAMGCQQPGASRAVPGASPIRTYHDDSVFPADDVVAEAWPQPRRDSTAEG